MPVTDLFARGDLWNDGVTSPPPTFTEETGFVLSTTSAGVGTRKINFIGSYLELPGTYTVALHVNDNPISGQALYLVLRWFVGPEVVTAFSLGTAPGLYTFQFTVPSGASSFSVEIAKLSAGVYVAPLSVSSLVQALPPDLNQPTLLNGGSSDYSRQLCYNSPVDYNNGRFVDPRSQTLAEIRHRILVRLGYSAQASSPPPGMADLLTDFINSANLELFERYPVMRLTRWWTWQTQPGQRFYDVPIDCEDYLDLRHITQAWLQDDQAWFPLVAGISPALFNQTLNSLPQYYEVRDNIELWPVPDKSTYLLHLEGEAGPSLMADDADTPAVDAHAVFLHALAASKAHYLQGDATRYDRQLEIYIGRLTAGSHYTKRYIPGESPLVGLPLPIRQVPGG